MGSRGTASRRLMKELTKWQNEGSKDVDGTVGIERLGPVNDDEILRWEAIINGRGIGSGYDDGRWLLIIQVPATYPLEPPSIRFATPVVHPNVHLETGEICLDLLRKDQGWSGTYTVAECVKAVRMLLGMPEVDSPLNVDVAALLRNGDTLAARGLVELWCREQRFDGP